MKKVITFFALLACAVCFSAPAQAVPFTITFDEVPAWDEEPTYIVDNDVRFLEMRAVTNFWHVLQRPRKCDFMSLFRPPASQKKNLAEKILIHAKALIAIAQKENPAFKLPA